MGFEGPRGGGQIYLRNCVTENDHGARDCLGEIVRELSALSTSWMSFYGSHSRAPMAVQAVLSTCLTSSRVVVWELEVHLRVAQVNTTVIYLCSVAFTHLHIWFPPMVPQ